MYSTIASLHIALDSRLLLLNSNRKLSIRPEQYDMVINDAILTVIKQRFSPDLNTKKQGFEESIKRSTDLNSIKVTSEPIEVYNRDDEQFFILPSNVYLPINLLGKGIYNHGILESTNITYNVYSLKFTNSIVSSINITIDGVSKILDITNITKSNRSLFYTINYLKEYLENNGVNCYTNTFDDVYNYDSLIIVTNKVVSVVANSFITISSSTKQYSKYTISTINLTKSLDLISSRDYNKSNNDYYSSVNLHLNPFYKLNDKLAFIKINSKFKFKNVILEYLKYPRLVNSILNQMTDVTITDEILDIAATNLSGILENNTYQSNINKQQINN